MCGNLLHNEAERSSTAPKGVRRVLPAGPTSDFPALVSSTSARTLILGIDKAGRILQHDRGAGDVLGDEPGALLGIELGRLITGPAPTSSRSTELIDAARADREGTTVLSISTAQRRPRRRRRHRAADPVGRSELPRQVIMRIPPPVRRAVHRPGPDAARAARRCRPPDRRRARHRSDGARAGQHPRPALLQRGAAC